MKYLNQLRQIFISCLAFVMIGSGERDLCGEDVTQATPSTQQVAFAKDADISWLSQMEATGYQFLDVDGAAKDCLQLLKDRGINSIRLRVFVNPSSDKVSGHCDKDETIAIAVRAKNMGMRVMVDFHYSDSWAGPAHQAKPALWKNHSFKQLLDDVYSHTHDVLISLQRAGVTPEWVQIGNEIPAGVLWPDGRSENNWSRFVQLLNKGYDATKPVDDRIKVIIHIDQGNDSDRLKWFFDTIEQHHAKFDVVGMFYYPFWLKSDFSETISDIADNLKEVMSRYDKDVMVVEVGGEYQLEQNTYNMLVAVIAAVKDVPGNRGLGVFYWEPQGEKSWSGYGLNAWRLDGKPSSVGCVSCRVTAMTNVWTPFLGILPVIDIASIGSSIRLSSMRWMRRISSSSAASRRGKASISLTRIENFTLGLAVSRFARPRVFDERQSVTDRSC